jgi:hypothetical protein
MGWLFAVALGLHRKSSAAVLRALPPIALGHALSIMLVAGTLLTAGILFDARLIRFVAGLILIGWAIYHTLYGHRHRVRVGMTTGQAGLLFWSFMMATAHGAGLMVLPALIPYCTSPGAQQAASAQPLVLSLAAAGVHTGAMLAVAGAVALAVYYWLGLAILRKAWLNLDLIWTAALAITGALLLILP